MGIIMNHKKISRIMKKYNLKTKIRKRNPYKDIAKKTEEHRTFENILNRKFDQPVPRKTFCTDITYLFHGYGKKAYLSVVKDIASKEIVGWSVSSHIDMDLVLNTLSNMKNNLNMISFKDILIHSDQGVHYTNPLYINSLKDLNMIQSMSKKGNCLDNAPIESFFGHLKDELDYKKCKTIEELRSSIADYINYYNNKRRQWDIQKMTPVMYRDHLLSLVD